MVVSVTDATCEFGLAQTAHGCTTTLAALCGDAYYNTQLVYCIAGFAVLCASAYKLACAMRSHGAAKLQKQIFALCFYAALTVTLRGVDPGSYAHYTPRPLSNFLSDTCTATLHTILIKTLSFYISITQHGTFGAKRQSLVVVERLAIACIWTFFLVSDASAIRSKGFGGVRGPVALYVSAGYQLVLSTSFVVYGLQVVRRLEAIDRMCAQQTQRMQAQCALDDAYTRTQSSRHSSTQVSSDAGDDDHAAVLEEVAQLHKRRVVRKPATRIRRVLLVTETASLLCVGAQVYFAAQRWNVQPLELDCANGIACDRIHIHVNPMHAVQYIWIWIALWSYWRTQPRATATTTTATRTTSQFALHKTPAGDDVV